MVEQHMRNVIRIEPAVNRSLVSTKKSAFSEQYEMVV
jgi:hypothetical protein